MTYSTTADLIYCDEIAVVSKLCHPKLFSLYKSMVFFPSKTCLLLNIISFLLNSSVPWIIELKAKTKSAQPLKTTQKQIRMNKQMQHEKRINFRINASRSKIKYFVAAANFKRETLCEKIMQVHVCTMCEQI